MAQFLVNAIGYGAECSRIMTAPEIFRMMDMEDCYDGFAIDVWKINGYGQALTECSFLGKWSADPHDPQRMEIRSSEGVEAVGYGTEH